MGVSGRGAMSILPFLLLPIAAGLQRQSRDLHPKSADGAHQSAPVESKSSAAFEGIS